MGDDFISDDGDWLDDDSGDNSTQRQKPKKNKTKSCPAVIYVPVRCPRCREKKKIAWTGEYGCIRYHTCNVCHLDFKSVEK